MKIFSVNDFSVHPIFVIKQFFCAMSNSAIFKLRESYLDFFRGLALCTIFIAHIPDNWLANYTPGKFGFSDSAELFMFISGYAAAKVFIYTFDSSGFIIGTARVLQRCWQLYIAHLGLFFVLAMICAAGNQLGGEIDYIARLNLYFFFERTPEALIGLFSLKYVPNYFDILPAYIVMLAAVPLVILLARIHMLLVPIACLSVYFCTWLFHLEFIAEIDGSRPWFFNPFGWQLLFFTGFMLGAGWIKVPQLSNKAFWLCVAFILLCIPLSNFPMYSNNIILSSIRSELEPLLSKTNLGILRWIHFLALATVIFSCVRHYQNLLKTCVAHNLMRIGQQGLASFLFGMVLSYLVGIVMDYTGRQILDTLILNLIGILILILAAYIFAWFKASPWKKNILYPSSYSPA